MPIPSSRERIVWRIHLRSSPQHIFDMLATDGGRARFWAESAVERDGVIDFRFINGMSTRGQVLERTPPRRFALEYFDNRVPFELAPDGRGDKRRGVQSA